MDFNEVLSILIIITFFGGIIASVIVATKEEKPA